MPSVDGLQVFALASFVLIVIPGPSVLFVVSRGVQLGRRAALLTVLGNTGGSYTQVLLVAVGVGTLVEQSAVIYGAIKLLGAAYLVYLGVGALMNRRGPTAGSEVPRGTKSTSALLRDGYVVGVTNPKTIVFLSAFLTQFVSSDGAPAPIQIALLGLVFSIIALVSDSAWGTIAGTARDWIGRSPEQFRRLSQGSGLVMVGLGVRLAISGRKD